MQSEARLWIVRIKSVEREHVVARIAVLRLDRQTRDDPATSESDIRLREITNAIANLEKTYLLRLFAEFEIALRHFPEGKRLNVPKSTEALIDRVRGRVGIPIAFAGDVHDVRRYRNFRIHDDATPVAEVPMREATRRLGNYLGWLQKVW